jgi:hypothetical protein
MNESLFLLDEQDNVGDVLGKINYNFLKHNNDLLDLESVSQKNFSTINKINSLMDRMDLLISQTDFNKFQDLDTTVNLLSSYWNDFEFTVQYPFNPENGFTSSLVYAGSMGELFGSTSLSDQENILANALLARKLPYIKNINDAKSNLYNNGIIIVNRNDYGDFVTWDFLGSSNIFNVLIDKTNNFYYNGRLIDIYNIPYYSVITKSDVDIFTSLSPDYDNKIVLSDKNIPLLPDKTSVSNGALIIYDTIVYNNYDLGDGTLAPVTQFIPRVEKLNNIIPANDSTFASKIQNTNNQTSGSFADNNKIHNIALNFLTENYPSLLYPDGCIANVVFLLYNYVGPNLGQTVVETLYWDNETLSFPQRNVENLKKSDVYKVAPSNNTTYNLTYSKQNMYIEKIVSVKYEKNVEMKDVVTVAAGVHKIITVPISSWKYKGINIGRNYTPNLFLTAGSYTPAQISGTSSPIYNG